MSKGIRFFGTDYNENQQGGTPDASSRDTFALFAFDGLIGTKWTSLSENTDGNDVYIEMDYGVNREIDSFFVYNTNIDDLEVQYFNGSIWVTCSSTIATITRSADLLHWFIHLNSQVTTKKVRVAGSNTITVNQEKYVTLFRAFLEIGQFEYFPDFDSEFIPTQNIFKVTDGRGIIFDRGEQFTASLDFKSHVNQNDITLAEGLITRKDAFFMWPNGGDESIFTYKFRPYRFQDIFKVGVSGKTKPKLTKNYYKSGYNNTINLIEVV